MPLLETAGVGLLAMNTRLIFGKILLFFLTALCQGGAAAETSFVKVKLATGISLDLPRNWNLIQGELNKAIETSAQAVLDVSGFDTREKMDINLIAANCNPATMYASVRLNVRRPALATPDDIRSFSTAEIKETEVGIKKGLTQMLPKQGFKLRDYISTTKEEIAGFPAIVALARRTDDAEGKETALVWVIQIFASGRTYRLNLAYRESEAAVWKPILERVKTSIRIEKEMAK